MIHIWTFVRREPLVHFTFLAALLFLANDLWSDADREVIRVDRTTQETLIQQRTDLLLRPPTAEEREEVIASYIEDEILWYEARRRGLDQTSRIRQQMVRGMRYLLLGDPPQPTEAELRIFYEEEKSRFEQPPALTLEHVFFSDPDTVPEATLAALRNGADPTKLGEFNVDLGRMIPLLAQRQLVQLFGPDGARRVLAIEDDSWHGPIPSPRGAHFVRIAKRHPVNVGSFEEAAPYLEGDWAMARQREILDQEFEVMRRDYRIIIEERVTVTVE